MVTVVTTLLFIFIIGQTAIEWYIIDWTFVKMGFSREAIYVATISNPVPWLHLLINTTYFGTLIAADWLMVRCDHISLQ